MSRAYKYFYLLSQNVQEEVIILLHLNSIFSNNYCCQLR